MGIIEVAHDEELGRTVALKQIRPQKADQAEYRQRFQLEAEITGKLEHPGIIPIYGLGTDGGGRPYYAMRLVRGDNLSKFIKQFHEKRKQGNASYDSVELHELIDRLIDVAQAISYAHHRGVIHRDLKPNNILVGKFGETLVIDWGLARPPKENATAGITLDSLGPINVRSGSNAAETLDGSCVGTLGYAPPEQAEGLITKISQRSDVYAIGAILYRILTDETPIPTKKGQDSRPRAEVIADTLAGRIIPPRKQLSSVPTPLSKICMKCLAREPSDRYGATANLVDDLKRWKADQPVSAYQEHLPEKIARLGRRHRGVVRALAASLLLIACISTISAVVVNHQKKEAEIAREGEFLARQRAEKSKAEAEAARNGERKARIEAERSANDLRSVLTTVKGAYESVGSARVESRIVTAKELLNRIRTRIDDPNLSQLAKLELCESLFYAYQGIGSYEAAVEMSRQARAIAESQFGKDDERTIRNMNNLGLAFSDAGNFEDAIRILELTLEAKSAKWSPDHAEVLRTSNNLALAYGNAGRHDLEKESLEKLISTIRRKLFKDSNGKEVDEFSDVGAAFEMYGRVKSIEIWLSSLNNLGTAYREIYEEDNDPENLQKSIDLLEAAVENDTLILGESNYSTLYAMHNLANSLSFKNDQRDRERKLLIRTLDLKKKHLPANHPSIFYSMHSLGDSFKRSDELGDAEEWLRQALAGKEARLGRNHPSTLRTMAVLGDVLKQTDIEGATKLHRSRHMTIVATSKNPNDVSQAHERLGLFELSVGNYDQAEERLREALQARGISDQQTGSVVQKLGETQLALGKWAEAEETLERAITLETSAERTGDSTIARVKNLLMHVSERSRAGLSLLQPNAAVSSWRFDSKSLVVGASDFKSEFSTIALKSGSRQRIAFGKDCSVQPHAMGLFAFTSKDNEIAVLFPSGVIQDLGRGEFCTWSRDANYIYFRSTDSSTMKRVEITKEGELRSPQTYFESSKLSKYARVSPNGRLVATKFERSIEVIDIESDEVVAIVEWHGSGFLPAWSPDSRFILAGSYGLGEEYGLWLFDVSNNSLRPVLHGDFTAPSWSWDGSKIAVDERAVGRPISIYTFPAKSLLTQGKALGPLELTLDLQRQDLAANDHERLSNVGHLATAYHAGGRLDEAIPLADELIQAYKDSSPQEVSKWQSRRRSLVELTEEDKSPTDGFDLKDESVLFWTNDEKEAVFTLGLKSKTLRRFPTPMNSPRGIQVLHSEGKVLVGDYSKDAVFSSNLDGSKSTTLIGADGVRGLAIDSTRGKLYWTDRNERKLFRANLDGTDAEVVVGTQLSYPYSVVVDEVGKKVYFNDFDNDAIYQCDLDGNRFTTFLTSVETRDLAFDPKDRILYFSHEEQAASRIKRKDSSIKRVSVEEGVPSIVLENAGLSSKLLIDPISRQLFFTVDDFAGAKEIQSIELDDIGEKSPLPRKLIRTVSDVRGMALYSPTINESAATPKD